MQTPYEHDVARVLAIYRVPTAPRPNRVLELCFGAPPIVTRVAWPGESATVCFLHHPACSTRPSLPDSQLACVASYNKDLPFAEQSFELVFIHNGLQRLISIAPEMRSSRALGDFAARVRRVLAPGGVFAGCVTSWTSRIGRRRAVRDACRSASFSIYSCRKILVQSGYLRVETFNVIPSADSPLRLISTSADLSRIGFRRELEATGPLLSRPAYLVRRALVELGLNRFLEPTILFWGYNP